MVGDDEMAGETVDVRTHEGQRLGKLSLHELETIMKEEYPVDVPLP